MDKVRLLMMDTRARLTLTRLKMLDYSKDPNPDNWRTISGAKVHLTNGKIDGGAGGKFSGKVWTGKNAKIKPENQHWAQTHTVTPNLFGGLELIQTKAERKEQRRQERIMRRAVKRNERYEAKRAEGLARQKELKEREAEAERRLLEEEEQQRKVDAMKPNTKEPTSELMSVARSIKAYLRKRTDESARKALQKAKMEWEKLPQDWRRYYLAQGKLDNDIYYKLFG